MSSDLPDFRYENSEAMARVLVTYMADPRAVLSAIKSEFHRGLSLGTIRRLREEHLRDLEKPAQQHFKAHEGYYPAEVSRSAAAANDAFLHRLRRFHPERFAA